MDAIISADAHLDPESLPPDTFTSRVSQKWKDRVPSVVTHDEGPVWVADGQRLGEWGGRRIRKIYANAKRGQKLLDGGIGSDDNRPGNPILRAEDMKKDGVDAEILYGAARRWKYLAAFDPELAVVTVAAYNEFIAEFAKSCPARILPLGAVPANDVNAMVNEVKHIAALGLHGIEVPLASAKTPVTDPYWDPLWQAAADHGLALHNHVDAPAAKYFSTNDKLDKAVFLTTAPMQMSQFFGALLLNGPVFERHPDIKFVFAETGIGWVPYLLDRMDSEWEDHYQEWKAFCFKPPSEYFRKHVFVTFQEDNIGPQFAEDYPNNFMWGSDYPHSDSVWPDSREVIAHSMGKLPDRLRKKMVCDNAAALYRLQ